MYLTGGTVLADAGRAAFQGPKVSSCLTPGTELSKETGVLTKQETIGKGRRGGEQ